jgi:hypothetical protein
MQSAASAQPVEVITPCRIDAIRGAAGSDQARSQAKREKRLDGCDMARVRREFGKGGIPTNAPALRNVGVDLSWNLQRIEHESRGCTSVTRARD